MMTLSTRKISTRSNQKKPSFLLRILNCGVWRKVSPRIEPNILIQTKIFT